MIDFRGCEVKIRVSTLKSVEKEKTRSSVKKGKLRFLFEIVHPARHPIFLRETVRGNAFPSPANVCLCVGFDRMALCGVVFSPMARRSSLTRPTAARTTVCFVPSQSKRWTTGSTPSTTCPTVCLYTAHASAPFAFHHLCLTHSWLGQTSEGLFSIPSSAKMVTTPHLNVLLARYFEVSIPYNRLFWSSPFSLEITTGSAHFFHSTVRPDAEAWQQTRQDGQAT